MIPALFRRKERARRVRQAFDRLERDIDPRFEDARWTNKPGGVEGEDLRYCVPHKQKRQLTWLSYVTVRLREAPSGAKLLDIGSNMYWAVGVAASALDVTVVDVRAHPLAESFPFRYVETSVAELPFDDEEFDVVSFPQLLHHVGLTFGQVVRADEYLTGLDELTRVLKVGGRAVLCTWVKGGRTSVGPARPRIFSLPHLRHLFGERGLGVVDLRLVSRDTFREIREDELRDDATLPADWALLTLRKSPPAAA